MIAATAAVIGTAIAAGVAFVPAGANAPLRARLGCRTDRLIVRVTSGDGPIQITGTGPHLPALVDASPLPATIALAGPGPWTGVTATELGGDHQSKLLAASIGCPATAPELQLSDGATPIPNGGTFDLGSTAVGVPVTRTLTITNLGTAPLQLGPAQAPNGFSFLSWPGGPLAPGQSANAVIRCDARTPGTFTGVVSFATNDADENPGIFKLTCVVGETPPPPAQAPEIQLYDIATPIPNGGTFDIGTTTVGTDISKVLSIANIGTATLTLGPPNALSLFTLTSPFPTSINAADASFVVIRCNASSPGFKTEVLTFPTNDSDENPTFVTLTCLVNQTTKPQLEVRTDIGDGFTGVVTPGQTFTVFCNSKRYFSVGNLGNGDLHVSSITVTSPFGTLFPAGSPPFTLSPAGTKEFDITVPSTLRCPATFQDPTTTITGTVTIVSDDPTTPTFTFIVQTVVAQQFS